MTMRAHVVASAAYRRVDARAGLPDEQKRKYGAIAHKLPGLILQNGLAQATGFLLAKGANAPEHLMLLDDLAAILQAGGSHADANPDLLHQSIIAADLQQTLRLSRAALEASAWIKRYVQGVLRIGATGDPVTEERA